MSWHMHLYHVMAHAPLSCHGTCTSIMSWHMHLYHVMAQCNSEGGKNRTLLHIKYVWTRMTTYKPHRAKTDLTCCKINLSLVKTAINKTTGARYYIGKQAFTRSHPHFFTRTQTNTRTRTINTRNRKRTNVRKPTPALNVTRSNADACTDTSIGQECCCISQNGRTEIGNDRAITSRKLGQLVECHASMHRGTTLN